MSLEVVPMIRAHGSHVAGPPMLRPSEIDHVLSAARRTPQAMRASVATPRDRPVSQMPGPGTKPGIRRVMSLPSDPTASGTGINPWWRYQEQNVPGGGHMMVNVGTGNVLLQDDDMSVPHKGIAMAFRRTYNSQMPAVLPGFWTSWQSLYGAGWTNTFDAHMVTWSDGTGGKSIYDIDGARYDYRNVGTSSPVWVSITPGQHAVLQSDGACGVAWTKKSGTVYYFYGGNPSKTCPAMGTLGGYAGRLYQIVGRNRNTYISFGYSWDNNDASVNGKISAITATTESGMTATLAFGDASGHRLLQQITYPDGATSVFYGYDAQGNLTWVSTPENNSSGNRPISSYGYQPVGTGSVIQYAASPRWNAGCSAGACGSDGGILTFAFAGSDNTSSTLTSIWHEAVVNPSIQDGTNSALQSGYSTTAAWYLGEYYSTGVSTPTFRDTDGHMTNWVVDAVGRRTQSQECTESANQGQQCIGAWLVTNESWDADNNLTAETDARGYETDYVFDQNGNTVAVGEPQAVTSQGSFRPVKLYDYDSFNNLTAFCDESETHAAGVVWSNALSGSDSLCATSDITGRHWRASLTYPAEQPYGQLATMTTPLGYTHHVAYSPSQQAGNDYGLPTSVTGDPFVQDDGSSITPTQTFWYDATGSLRCYNKGSGLYTLSYDTLGRLTSEADPDDSSANSGSLCGKGSGQPGWNTQTTYTYFPSGAKQRSQTPAERAGNVASTYTYDVDRNAISETHYYGCAPGTTCSGGLTTKWYDGADRLIEVEQPTDPSDYYPYPWLTRYIYDLAQGGTDSIASTTFQGHGNLFKTQEWLTRPGATAPSWTDLRGNAFDALDRTTAKYAFPPSADTTLSIATSQYDASTATLGLLASQRDALGETVAFTYDSLGHQASVSFSGDGGVTSPKTFTYDPNGRQATVGSSLYGTQTMTYDQDGRVAEIDEPTGGSITSPARLTYDYYPNGDRKHVNVTSSALTASPLIAYVRRADNELTRETVSYRGITSTFTWSYSDAGRVLSQTDPYTGTAIPSPQSPVAANSVYAPTTTSYDGTGQLTGHGLPETLNYSVGQHDDEGHMLAWGASVTGSSSFSAGTQYYNTTRGENFKQITNAGALMFDTRTANGAIVPAVTRAIKPPSVGSSPILDPINAVVLGTTITGNGVDGDGNVIPCTPLQKTDTYDAASRLIWRSMDSMTPAVDTCGLETNDPMTWSYDAENHTLSQAAGTAQWAPIGKPFHIVTSGSNDYLHYDGDQLLFLTDAQGNITDIKLGALADVSASGQMTVWDRDPTGMLSTGHNNSLYYGISFGVRKFGPYKGGNGLGSLGGGGLVPTIFSGSTSAPPCTVASCGFSTPYRYSRLEGFDWGNLTVQGVRTVDAMSGQWTTPDPFAGDVHDPMSQKAFMWDRNNPYEYSDPSGYCKEGKDGCMGGVDWNAMSRSVNIMFIVMTFFLPGGAEAKAAEAVGDIGIAGASQAVGHMVGPSAPSAEAIGLAKQLISQSQLNEAKMGIGKSIAGAGSNTTLRDAASVAQRNGGKAQDWAKMTTGSYRAKDGSIVEVHWYQNKVTGQNVEFKSTILRGGK
jgi:YD repeat-containing protein